MWHNRKSPHYLWLTGNGTNRVRCPDSVTREMTFPEFISWQWEWSCAKPSETPGHA